MGRLSGGYAAVLRSPGVPRLVGAFLALGIANTMTPVAFVLFVRNSTHSLAAAGLVLAASTAGTLLFGPARGRLVDRLGPSRAVLTLLVPDLLTDGGLIVAGLAHIGAGPLVAVGFVSGATTAPAVAALRSTWSNRLGESQRQAGFALMTMMQETSFIVGPLAAGVAISIASPAAAVATSAALSFAGALAFMAAPGPDAQPRPAPGAGRFTAVAGGGIRTVLATSAPFGMTFGILDVAFPAFARAHGSPATAGVLLAAFAAGSWIGGFAYGLAPAGRGAGTRYPPLCLLATLGLVPLVLAPGLAAMSALAALSGLCFAPITTCRLAVIDEVAPPGHRAEAFSWLSSLYATGLAAGAAIAGPILATAGIRVAVAAACAATATSWLIAALRADTLRAPRRAVSER